MARNSAAQYEMVAVDNGDGVQWRRWHRRQQRLTGLKRQRCSGNSREGGSSVGVCVGVWHLAVAAAAARVVVVGANSDDGHGDNGSGSSDGGCVNIVRTMSVTMTAAVAVMVVAEATATETVMTAAAMAGVKRQQSTSNGSVEGRRWTRARQRVTTSNKST